MAKKTVIVGVSKDLNDTVESWSKKDNSFLHSVIPKCFKKTWYVTIHRKNKTLVLLQGKDLNEILIRRSKKYPDWEIISIN